jgi:hypothetical protein
LTRLEVTKEPGCSHRVLKKWVIVEEARIQRQVTVLGRLCERDRCARGPEVYRLGADDDYRVTMHFEGVERVK